MLRKNEKRIVIFFLSRNHTAAVSPRDSLFTFSGISMIPSGIIIYNIYHNKKKSVVVGGECIWVRMMNWRKRLRCAHSKTATKRTVSPSVSSGFKRRSVVRNTSGRRVIITTIIIKQVSAAKGEEWETGRRKKLYHSNNSVCSVQ